MCLHIIEPQIATLRSVDTQFSILGKSLILWVSAEVAKFCMRVKSIFLTWVEVYDAYPRR